MEIIYWPLLDLLLWGFLTLYLARYKEGLPGFVAFLLGALIFWDILLRAQQGICIFFLEEIWARNFLNLFVSPLGIGEFLASTMLVSLIKVIAASIVTINLAYVLYSFSRCAYAASARRPSSPLARSAR